MIALPALVIIADLTNSRTPVKQPIFEVVSRWTNRRRDAPQHHFEDRAIIIIDALMEKQFRFHPSPMIAYATIWFDLP